MMAPAIWFNNIFCFKNKPEIINTNTGAAVVPIMARLVAEVYFPATYKRVLKSVTPVNAVKVRYLKWGKITFHSEMNFLKAIGNRIMVATDHRKNDRDIGEILLCKALAAIKFPDHNITANSAKPKPVRKILLLGIGYWALGIGC